MRARAQARHSQPSPGNPIRHGDEHWDHFSAVANHAFAAQRHPHEFGTTSEDLAHVAVATRKHACLNRNEIMRKAMTVADHQASRYIVDPLRLFDCALESDGGGAVLVTSAERARDFSAAAGGDSGRGQHHPHFSLMDAPSLTTLGGKKFSELAHKMVGVTREMDFAEIYDCFTITTMTTLEDYGFCKKGEGKDFVKNGRIEVGGELPGEHPRRPVIADAYRRYAPMSPKRRDNCVAMKSKRNGR